MTLEQFKKRALNEGRLVTDEQKAVVDVALAGSNILVDACIGSGKTYTLRLLYNKLEDKSILYLTYNRLLKLEAQATIPNREGSTVTNYHSFVYHHLTQVGIKYTNERGIPSFIRACDSGLIELPAYDVLLLDEYQDITDDIADLLECLKRHQGSIQIIAVGDMSQKIHDYTSIDAATFIDEFLGERVNLFLTQCFRLSEEYAAQLGRCWGKDIKGVNKGCTVNIIGFEEAVEIALGYDPKDILVLGSSRSPTRAGIQNSLEALDSKKFNKHTLYSSISDRGDGGAKSRSIGQAAIFTSYDRSKGLERDICFVCDFTEGYWGSRKEYTRYQTLRNLYLVAASRGKKSIYFVKPKNSNLRNLHYTKLAGEPLIGTPYFNESVKKATISEMFLHIDTSIVRKCRDLLSVEAVNVTNTDVIPSQMAEGFIDLSPCIGMYAGALYFDTYPKAALLDKLHKSKIRRNGKIVKNDLKIAVLCEVSEQVRQNRYKYKVYKDYLPDSSVELVKNRLSEQLPPSVETEVQCELDLNGQKVYGRCDAMHQEIPYELKFVTALTDVHLLQCACYTVALLKPYGVLWNIRDNTCYKVKVLDIPKFKEAVYRGVFNRQV